MQINIDSAFIMYRKDCSQKSILIDFSYFNNLYVKIKITKKLTEMSSEIITGTDA